jgi:hypothetical protein
MFPVHARHPIFIFGAGKYIPNKHTPPDVVNYGYQSHIASADSKDGIGRLVFGRSKGVPQCLKICVLAGGNKPEPREQRLARLWMQRAKLAQRSLGNYAHWKLHERATHALFNRHLRILRFGMGVSCIESARETTRLSRKEIQICVMRSMGRL